MGAWSDGTALSKMGKTGVQAKRGCGVVFLAIVRS